MRRLRERSLGALTTGTAGLLPATETADEMLRGGGYALTLDLHKRCTLLAAQVKLRQSFGRLIVDQGHGMTMPDPAC